MNNFKKYFSVSIKGFCMGCADVIPGVSGGTVAFILGIYEELINATKTLDLTALKLLLGGKFKALFEHVHWRFLLAVVVGILTAIISLVKPLSWLLEHKPVEIHAFFFGLILASILIIVGHIKKWNVFAVVWLVIASILAYILVGLVPVQTPDDLWFVFLCGAVAICAMILPGISGSFILLLLGKYSYIINAIHERNILVLVVFVCGIGVGILSFIRVVSWLFEKYHTATIAGLTGLMIGSLRKIWPWKNTLETTLDRHGELIPIREANFLPSALTGEVLAACSLLIFGFVLAVVVERKISLD